MTGRPSKWAVFAAIFVAGIGLDQWTKYLAVSRLTDLFARVGAETLGQRVTAFFAHRHLEALATDPYYVFRPWWRMLYVENPNAAFGLGHFLPPGVRIAVYLVAAVAASGLTPDCDDAGGSGASKFAMRSRRIEMKYPIT